MRSGGQDAAERQGHAVTGAGSGIGRAIARAYAARGAKVMVTDLNVDNAATVAQEIVASGGTATSAHLDVTDREQHVALVAQVEKQSAGWILQPTMPA